MPTGRSQAAAWLEALAGGGPRFVPRSDRCAAGQGPRRDSVPEVSRPQAVSVPDVVREPAVRGDVLSAVASEVAACKLCRLCEERKRAVPGEGNPRARIAFVGEGPGAEEDRTGRPFVGAAGQLLTKMIEAMKLRREDVYITNIVKCRPPDNRTPQSDEIACCLPYLERQLDSIRPECIVALGKPATLTLLDLPPATPISRVRGRFHEWRGVALMPTFHPAYLLRNPSEKRVVWEDLKKVMERLGLSAAG